MSAMDALVKMVNEANPERDSTTLNRRLLKVLEEIGEVSEAYLSTTSATNYKNKTWLDYREEAVDTLIILLDIALTPLPETNYPPAALLPQTVSYGQEFSFKDQMMLEGFKFEIVRAIGSAEAYLRDSNQLGFYGAIVRGITAASKICFATIPEDSNPNIINKRVEDLFRLKLDKWINSQSKTTDDAS